MHIHILGVCGTFMGGIAAIAQQAGRRVTGCDANVYPPMSEQLRGLGIELIEGYGAEQLRLAPDLWVVGNVVTRGNPLMEAILDRGDRYVSGPQWLAEHLLVSKWVLAVAGTHGKTSTSSMLAWILMCVGQDPGFLIGGVAPDLKISARSGGSKYFVIESDEYDTAFFDKRSKFVHYRPRTAILNNLEFDLSPGQLRSVILGFTTRVFKRWLYRIRFSFSLYRYNCTDGKLSSFQHFALFHVGEIEVNERYVYPVHFFRLTF